MIAEPHGHRWDCPEKVCGIKRKGVQERVWVLYQSRLWFQKTEPQFNWIKKKWRREECLLTPITKDTREGTCGLIHGCMVDAGCSKITWGFFLLPSFQIASFSCMFSLCCGKDDPEDLLYLLRNPNRKGVYLFHHLQKKDQDYFSSVHRLWTHSWDNHYDFVWAWVTRPPLALRSGLRSIQHEMKEEQRVFPKKNWTWC